MTGGTSLPHSGNAMEIPFSSRTGWMSPDSSILSKTYFICTVYVSIFICMHVYESLHSSRTGWLRLDSSILSKMYLMYTLSCIHVYICVHICTLVFFTNHEARFLFLIPHLLIYVQLHIHMYIFMCTYAYAYCARTEPHAPIHILFAYVYAHVHAYVYIGVYTCN